MVFINFLFLLKNLLSCSELVPYRPKERERGRRRRRRRKGREWNFICVCSLGHDVHYLG